MRWTVLYPETENYHLTKEVGMVPYTMHKVFGMDAEIVTYNNGDYPYLDTDVKGLRLTFIEKKAKSDFGNMLPFIVKHARAIDVLEVIHKRTDNLLLTTIYKVLHPKGKVYLRLDAGDGLIDRCKKDRRNILKEFLRGFYMRMIDCVSAESQMLTDFVKQYHKDVYKCDNVHFLPNGFSIPHEYHNWDEPWNNKKNVILSVGRFGTDQKATDVFLAGLEKIKTHLAGWQVWFVGPVEESFEKAIDQFYEKNPELCDVVLFKGPIFNRKKISQIYMQSKFFCLTSRWEGSPNVLPEAAFFKNYLITTELAGTKEIVKNGELGRLFTINDVDAFADILREVIDSYEDLAESVETQRAWVLKNYNWEKTCAQLHAILFGKEERQG